MQVTEGVFSYIKQVRFPSKQAAKQMEIKIIFNQQNSEALNVLPKIDHCKLSKGER